MKTYIAKTDSGGNILSLTDHLLDTLYVAKELNAHYCPDSMVDASGMSREEFSSIFCFLTAIHDLGKATPAFQKKINGEDIEFKHALAGASILSVEFGISNSICEIVAAHHGAPRSLSREESFDKYFRKNRSKIGNDTEAWMELYEQAVRLAGTAFDPNADISIEGQMILSGMLIMADWIASNEMFFPLMKQDDILSNAERSRREKSGWRELSLPDYWEPDIPNMDSETFAMHFGFFPNAMQKEVLSVVNTILSPGIIIIEAPMGIGKTEAGLASAEVVSSRVKAGGVFFGLPTRGTANGMFPRMLSWAEHVSDDMSVSLRLAHSDANNNNEYRLLQVRTYEERGVSVNSWLSGRHRALLSDFVIGTVDQFLLAGLLQKYIMLLLAGLSGKTIIIDEVHAYDAYMDSFMEAVLSWMGAFHVPVILLSATLTNQKREDFISAYSGLECHFETMDYPCITWSDSDAIQTKALNIGLQLKTVTVEYVREDEVKNNIYDQKDASIGIIVNSVKRAQELYDSLKEAYPHRKIILLHSRYLPKDRSELEDMVVQAVGKHSTLSERNGTIIIGTQVLEQSLDIDFDVLYTEKCPIDLLFQRIGRLHRHVRVDRPIADPVCYIIDGEKSDRTAKYLYSDFLIDQTVRTIGSKSLEIPFDIKPMTEAVYNTDNADDTSEKEAFLTKIRELRSNADSFCISKPEDTRMRGLLEIDANGQESVRYGNFGLEVLLWKQDKDGSIGTFDGNCNFHGDPLPENINVLLKQNLSLSQRYIGELNVIKDQQKELPAWTKMDIFKYKLIIIADENGMCRIGRHTCSYNKDYGLKEVDVEKI
ncbi:MAG: CRISPR-associated helicase Cas3' [Firmicutes bacterium]|nr:CRISPR-associated helicase Cas3' [Bacillota bacterium]